MRPLLPLVVLLVPLATAGPFGRKKKDDPPEVVEPPPPPEPVIPAPVVGLWTGTVPLEAGPVPEGLANLSSQGCNACHYEAHDDWAPSAHATGWSDAGFRAAVDAVGTPACTTCHLPLARQWDQTVQYAEGDVNHALGQPNPAFDATLRSEGVTCAACHVRDGQVIGARWVEDTPHDYAWSEELSASEACATCHQLTWPGAETPLYDTYGEWSRSPQKEAGIQCQDCHMRGGTAGSSGHAFPDQAPRALSLLIDLDRLTLRRGGAPLVAEIEVQNTGAGHSVPTGSPFKGIRMTSVLVGPAGEEVAPTPVDFGRTLSDEAPWTTLEDTRLGAAETRQFSHAHALPLSAEGGDWAFEVRLEHTVRGKVVGEPFVVRRLPLVVD